VLFQAGTSKPDAAFAVKHAEAFFLNTATITQAKKTIADARVAVAARGRDPKSVKFFPCIVPFIGRTVAEGREKYTRAKELAVPIAGLGQLSGYTGIDMSMYPLDEPIALSKANQAMAIQSVFRALEASEASSGPWTPRRLGIKMALGRLHPSPVGSVEQVADVFEAWATEADCDGFNVASVVNPGSWVDVVELLVPELRKRGMYWDDYEVPVGTFKENLYGKGQKELREDHYGSKFKWGKEIEWDNKVEEYVVVPEAKKFEEEKGPSQSLRCCPYGSGRGSGVGK
jgi:alkanesulfonate monooxygenase SsuD/methylene tetrahydromethanopterin reductase-like flavin-dependent oxidoreductase (luciferase family)